MGIIRSNHLTKISMTSNFQAYQKVRHRSQDVHAVSRTNAANNRRARDVAATENHPRQTDLAGRSPTEARMESGRQVRNF